MDLRCMAFKIHEAFKRELSTSVVGEWAALTGLKPMMPVIVALQRMFATEDVLLFEQGQRGVTEARQTLERLALEGRLTAQKVRELA